MKTQIFIFLILISSMYVFSQDKPEILADKYLLLAKDCIDKNDNPGAIDYFKKIFALKIPVPDELYYFYGRTLYNNGNNFEAGEIINKYLNKAGQEGQYYMEALKLSVDLEKNNYFIDSRDNNKYKIVEIGNQTWMAKNLNYNTSNSWCNQCETYGRLYTYDDAKKACPAGWHLPSDAEWEKLTDYLGGVSVAGGKLKSTTGWKSPNTGATNESGFAALPGGRRNNDGVIANTSICSLWWSSSLSSKTGASVIGVFNIESSIYKSFASSRDGFSVRCLKD